MKRIIVLLITICFISTRSMSAYASDLDLSSYSDDEIETLLDRVQQEIVDRKIEKNATLAAGTYIAGEDIPTGTYTVYCKYEGDIWADIYIFPADNPDEYSFDGIVYAKSETDPGEGTWKINVEEGDRLECTYEITLTVFAGIVFK